MAFYWYELRPSAIRKECHDYATELAVYRYADKYPHRTEEISKLTYLIADYERFYLRCLRERGT